MSFVQIVEYETDKPAEIMAAADEMPPGERPWTRLLVAQDHDHPGRYVTVVEFPSYEAAMANNDRPETQAFAKTMRELCTGEPTFQNLDVREIR